MTALAAAFGFLSRLPIGGRAVEDVTLGRSLAWFPAVGLVFGLILAGAAALLRDRIPAPLLAVGLVAALALLSGGLHLDGVADVFDGLGGGRGDRERILAIMRDSRIGAHGAAALVMTVLAKVAAVHELVRAERAWALLAGPAVARWCAVLLVLLFPYARPHGLGRAMRDHGRPRHLAAATALLAGSIGWSGARVLGPAAAAAAAALLLACAMRRRLGGLTGDVYGAAIELAELAFLAAASLDPAQPPVSPGP